MSTPPGSGTSLDSARLAIYRANGMSTACFFCFLSGETRSRFPIVRPPAFPMDLQTAIAGFQDSADQVGLCEFCARLCEVDDVDRVTGAVLSRIAEAPWILSCTIDQQVAFFGLFALTQYTWWTSRFVNAPLSPALRFFCDLVSITTTKLSSGNTRGVFEIFNRDMGLDCYTVVVPAGDRVQVVDLASRIRGKGYGGIALRKLCDLADRHGVILTGVVEPHDKYGGRRGALSTSELLHFYGRYGFVVTGTYENHKCVERPPCSGRSA